MRLACWILLLAATPALAEETLTLEAALAKGRESSRELAVSRARLGSAEAGVDVAKAALYPTLGAQGRYTHNSDEAKLKIPTGATPPAPQTRTVTIQDDDQFNATINASIPIVSPAAWASLGAAKKSYEAAQATTLAGESDVLLTVARSFYAAAGADELLQAMTNSVEVAKKSLDDARVRVDAGTRNRVEVTRAELALVRAEQARLEAADLRDRSYRGLATLLRMKEPFRVVAPEAPKASPAAPAELATGAAQRRPELRAMRSTISASEAQSKAALFRSFPTLSAFGNASYASYEGFSGKKDAWAVGALLEWSIFDGGARYAQRRQAKAAVRESEARLSLLEDQVRDEVTNARAAVDVKRAALDSATRAVALSKESLDLIRAQQEAGRATQLDQLQSQDALVAAEVALARARFDLGLATVELERAAGTFASR